MICLSAQSGFAKCRRCCPRWTAPHGRSFDQIYTATQATIAVCHPVEAANIVIWTESCEEVHRALLQFPSRMTVSQAAGRALVMLMTRRVAKFAGTMVLLLAIAIFQPWACAVAQPTSLDHRVPSARSQFFPLSPATGQLQKVTPQLRTSDGPPPAVGIHVATPAPAPPQYFPPPASVAPITTYPSQRPSTTHDGPPPPASARQPPAETTEGDLAIVPSIMGDSPAQARVAVANARLMLPSAGPLPACARVVFQSPSAGRRVRRNSTVEARFEAPSVTVPSIIGESLAQAGQVTAGAQLSLRPANDASSAGARVTRQSPTAGAHLQCGGTVEAFFEAQPVLVTVPSIIGDSPAQARRAIADASLSLYPAGAAQSASAQVTRQSPPAGERVSPGRTVEAWFVAAPPVAVLPNPRPMPEPPVAVLPNPRPMPEPPVAVLPNPRPMPEPPVAVLPSSRPMAEPEPKSKLDLPPSTPINPMVMPPSNARAATLQPTPQSDQTPAQGPRGSENQQAVTAPSAVSQLVRASALLGFATLLGFAPVGWAFRRLRRRPRPPHLALWQVAPRSDPGRQWIASRDDPVGPVLGLRITHAGPAAELFWAKEEARHV